MKRLLLVNPVGRRSGFLLSKFTTFPPLGLAYVAAVTPADWHIKILDENFDDFVYEDADIVGITAFTSNITRAYEIARIYRDRNVKVVMGGIHVSMLPDEALQYADVVVIGEAEGIWGKVLEDFENNQLQALYQGPQVDLEKFDLLPRRDLLHPNYYWASVQTSRGCPFDCDFCSVSTHMGRKYRRRKASKVLEEIALIENKNITFVDDNLIGYSEEDKLTVAEIFSGMAKRHFNKRWWMQTSINAAEDESILELAAKAGCMFAFVGFESIESETLERMKKGINQKTGIDNYVNVVDTFHKFGLGVMGAFIIGNPNESMTFYERFANFLYKSGMDVVQLTILTPMPGTRLMQKMLKEDSLLCVDFPQDWDKYRFSYVVHRTEGLDENIINEGYRYIKNRLYSFPFYHLRLMKALFQTRMNFLPVLHLNNSLRKSWLHSHHNK